MTENVFAPEFLVAMFDDQRRLVEEFLREAAAGESKDDAADRA